jgi:signal transduction histidine kinase
LTSKLDTEHAEIDVELRLQLLDATLNSIDQGFVVWDDKDRLIICNDRFRKLWGYPKSLAKPGAHATDLIRFDAEHGKHENDNIEKWVTKRNKKAQKHFKDGTSEQFTTNSGRVLFIRRYTIAKLGQISTFTDITDVKAAETELAAQTRLLETTLNSIDQGVAIWSNEEKLVICNDRFRELWRYPEDLVKPGTPSIELLRYLAKRGEYGPGDPETVAQNYLKSALEKHHSGTDEQHTVQSGQTFYIRRYPSQDSGTVSTFTDISDLKITEAALLESEEKLRQQIKELEDREEQLNAQKAELITLAEDLDRARERSELLNSQKDKFFSIIAHDLTGPFNALLGYSSLLSTNADRLDADTLKESAGAIHESGERLSKLLENLLTWSRLQMERVNYELSEINMNNIIDDNVALFRPMAEQKGVDINYRSGRSLSAFADKIMVDVIARNLISNAIKFTPKKGRVAIRVKKQKDHIVLTVSDTGVGMSNKKLEKLFRIEEWVSTNGTNGETGTGLGLQLCKEFADILNGKLLVTSEKGVGTEFKVHFPLP